MLRLWSATLVMLLVMLALASAAHRRDAVCHPACWHGLNLGASNSEVREVLAAYGFAMQGNQRYEWSDEPAAEFSFLMRDGSLQRIDAGWASNPPEQQPMFGELLLLLGPPDAMRLESEVVVNVRRLTVTVVYRDEEHGQITLLTLRRIGNDPTKFGPMRLRPTDRVLRLSRYSSRTPFTLEMVEGWMGFARYPVNQVCC